MRTRTLLFQERREADAGLHWLTKVACAPRGPGTALLSALGARGRGRGGQTVDSWFHSVSSSHSPCRRARVKWGQPASFRSWLRRRYLQSPGPRTPQHLPANFCSFFSSQLHPSFLQEALPDLPRTGKCASPTMHHFTPTATLSHPHQCKACLPVPLPTLKGSTQGTASFFLFIFFLQHISQRLAHSKS